MLTVQDVADRLNVSAACVYALVARNDLPHVRIGTGRGTIRILEEDLGAYLSGRRRDRPPEPEPSVPMPLKHLRVRTIPR